LSLAIGTPNACTQCHTDRDAGWAARTVAQWFPNGRQTTPHYGTALHAGRVGAADAEAQLDRLILDPTVPAIARGSAVVLLRAFLTNGSSAAVTEAASDPDPIVRAAVPRMLPAALSPAMVQSVAPLLKDPVRAVRIETARALAGVEPQSLAPEQRTALSAAYLELVTAEQVERDRPEAHLNIGLLNSRRRQPDLAEAEYRTALRLDPNFVPALANLADLERMRGRDQRGAELLRKAVEIEPNNANVRHALGLLLVRQHDYAGAIVQLRQAAELAPDNARYAYVYAVALNSTGASDEALALLERAHERHPADRDVLAALIGFTRSRGNLQLAGRYARELSALDPSDAQVRALVQELERGGPR
jgi:Flp pilus assembly protein TadD